MTLPLIYGLTALSSIITVFSEFRNYRQLIYLFKPLTMLILIAMVFGAMNPELGSFYPFQIGIFVSLIFCLGGDIALMFQESDKLFRNGIILFLLGHVGYIVTMGQYVSITSEHLVYLVPMTLLGTVIYGYLYSGLGKFRIPVLVYVVVIVSMVTFALAAVSSDFFTAKQALLLSWGSILFFISDIILAVSKFKRELKYNRLSLFVYFGGQALIASATL
jgi:uncharacterized membrane protein YhhN